MPIAYLKTKDEFLADAPRIADVVKDAVATNLHRNTPVSSRGEYASWKRSLTDLFFVLTSPEIPGDSGVAIEYRMIGGNWRVDAMLTGLDSGGQRRVVVIELKQWSDDYVQYGGLKDHVLVEGLGGTRSYEHPSAQALDYAYYFENFYEVATSGEIQISPCAYLHELNDPSALNESGRKDTLSSSPFFIKGEGRLLQDFITERIVQGDEGEAVRILDDSEITPSKRLADDVAEMLRGNSQFQLIGKQREALSQIERMVHEAGHGGRRVLIINGGPGTGKSVIAFHAMSKFLKDGLNVRYVTKNAAPREVFGARLRDRNTDPSLRSLLMSSDAFWKMNEELLDVVLVDEAHRLVHKSGIFRNQGDNQVAEIIDASRVSVFFLDESQAVTWRDMGTRSEIVKCAELLGVEVVDVEIGVQFRCAGADEYVDWVDRILGIKDDLEDGWLSGSYSVEVVDSASELKNEIRGRNLRDTSKSSRLLAGYCWDWKSRQDSTFDDIVIGDDFAMKWNLMNHGQGWIANPEGAEQVGCVFTAQGLECPYAGVIVGPDLIFRDGALRTDPFARAKTDRQTLWGWKTLLKDDRDAAFARADRIIRNQYKVLLTRAMKGTWIFSTDRPTNDYLKEQVIAAKLRNL